jgi:hypothetical protein
MRRILERQRYFMHLDAIYTAFMAAGIVAAIAALF